MAHRGGFCGLLVGRIDAWSTVPSNRCGALWIGLH
jgi:hypothetical protein